MKHVRRFNNKLIKIEALIVPFNFHSRVSIGAYNFHNIFPSRALPQHSRERRAIGIRGITLQPLQYHRKKGPYMGMMCDNAKGCDVSTANGDSSSIPLRKIIKFPITEIFFRNTKIPENAIYKFQISIFSEIKRN